MKDLATKIIAELNYQLNDSTDGTIGYGYGVIDGLLKALEFTGVKYGFNQMTNKYFIVK